MGIAAHSLIKEMLSRDVPAVITNIAEDPQGQEKWTLGRAQEIEGTDFVYISLVSEKKSISIPEPGMMKALPYSERYFAPSRNLLFVNKKTREMRWLFKNNRAAHRTY